jgi:CBS-domain-containing membrane protein
MIQYADENESLRNALAKMSVWNIGSIVVIRGHKVVGILTERDVLQFWQKWGDRKFLMQPIGRVMTTPVTTLETPHWERAARLMAQHNFRHVPVVHEDGTPAGIISVRDVIRHFTGDVTEKERLAAYHAGQRKDPRHQEMRATTMTIHAWGDVTELRTRLMSLSSASQNVVAHESLRGLVEALRQQEPTRNVMYVVDLDTLHPMRARTEDLFAQRPNVPLMVTWTASTLSDEDLVWIHKAARKSGVHAFEKPVPAVALELALAWFEFR